MEQEAQHDVTKRLYSNRVRHGVITSHCGPSMRCHGAVYRVCAGRSSFLAGWFLLRRVAAGCNLAPSYTLLFATNVI
jgi:hypothetical protein